jgi:hypothetical protein
MRNFRASSSRVAVWKVARLEKEDRTSEDKPRRERGTDNERVGYAGKDRDARLSVMIQGLRRVMADRWLDMQSRIRR